MALVRERISLFDVTNCEAFVQRAIDKSQIPVEPGEISVLLAEGWAILYELAYKYKPLPEPPGGYAQWFQLSLDQRQACEAELQAGYLKSGVKCGRFSGHIAMFLPRRLGDAWHKMHPEHRYVTDPETGQRGWRYEAPMLSLDQITSSSNEEDCHGGERHLLHARSIAAFCHASAVALRGRPAARAA